MLIESPIYGEVNVDNPVLLELMKTPQVQRLSGISQYGLPDAFSKYPGFSRLEHSVGVMLLLRRLGAPLEEQAAGLLHDVSHTAFSHIVDWIIGDPRIEDYQDRNLSNVLESSEIPRILATNGLDVEDISHQENYPLLEQDIPELCADRVDYALREFQLWAGPQAVQPCLEALVVHNDKMVFNSRSAAKTFGNLFLRLQTEHWASPDTCVRYFLFSRALKSGIGDGTIDLIDLEKDDNFVMDKLRAGNNPIVKNAFNHLDKSLSFEIDNENPEYKLGKKFRHVDPPYLEGGKVTTLSETDPEFRALLAKEREINRAGINIKHIRWTF
jgi:uncharacterized protein